MKETYYFSHDYNARNDEKIIRLVKEYGWQGYGLFWAIIEKLYEAGGFLEKDYDCIAFDLRTDCERIKEVVESGLFKFSKEKFYSDSVLARLRVRKGKSEQARQSALIRWNKPKKENANAMRTQCGSNAIKERKGKERKGKEINTQSAKADDTIYQDAKAIIEYWSEKWQRVYNQQPAKDYAKYIPLAKKRINQIGLEKLKAVCDVYFTTDDQFFKSKGWNFMQMLSSETFNSLLTKI
jgi:hypothetical protein